MHLQKLYLSKDLQFLADEEGRNIAVRVEDEEQSYYTAIGLVSDAYEKICIGTTAIKVCTSRDNRHMCTSWKEVNICNRWKLVSTGYSSIS